MKRLISLLLLILLFIANYSCDYLEYDESSYLQQEDVFNDFERTKSFLTGIYAYLPEGFAPIDGAMRSSASDDAVHVWDNSEVQKFNDGSWSAIHPIDDVYSNMFTAIRAVNRFLDEIDGQSFEEEKWSLNYNEMMQQFDLYPYEARFLRAFFYFELVKRYNAVPLITDVLTPEDANKVTQTTFDTIINFIVSECDTAAAMLPFSYADLPEGETGRATRGAAIALKTRALLYAASPLHNSSNDQAKWILAASSAAGLIDSAFYDLESAYSDVVNNPTSVELIFATRQNESNYFEKNNFPLGYEGGKTGTCPTQNLVNAYEMVKTGLAIDEAGSGYDPNFPYEGRDPRFGQTILYNSSSWKGQTIETWIGGKNALPKANATKTGYYLKKYVIESINLETNNTTVKRHTWVLFRYAEVLLNYAEAMNEAYGPVDPAGNTLTAMDAANMVRQRAGMPAYPGGISQADFRTKLRNERRVELAFEDHRFWDIRRWMIAASKKDIFGVEITKNVYGGFAYKQKLVEERIFEEYMNLYPIPQSEVYLNDNIVQNTNW